MKTKYDLVMIQKGELGELLDNPAKVDLTIDDVITVIEKLSFIGETIAHLRGNGAEILKTTDAARAMVAKLKGEA